MTILFSGKMSYHANAAAALHLTDRVMPLVWKSIPAAQVIIVGQKPPATLLQRARTDPQRIRVTGSVPDIRPFLARATIACAPMVYGVGVQNKILEAMAMRLPVVASLRAARPLRVENERELLVGRDPDELAAQLVRVLRDPHLGRRLAGNARSYVETHHRWQDSAVKLETLYQQTTL
jgi:glycosyltransferase involved in cell wall biosynthesis